MRLRIRRKAVARDACCRRAAVPALDRNLFRFKHALRALLALLGFAEPRLDVCAAAA